MMQRFHGVVNPSAARISSTGVAACFDGDGVPRRPGGAAGA
jgi:hypothetical protein